MRNFELLLIDDILATDQMLVREDLEDIVQAYGDAYFKLDKSRVLELSDQCVKLASEGLYRLPLLSVINGASMVAVSKSNRTSRTQAVHNYAYSAKFADIASNFEDNVSDVISDQERHFFTHGLLKAVSFKKFGPG